MVLRVALLASCAGAFELNTVRLQRRAAGAVEARISVMMGMPDELHDTPDVPELPEECGPYLTIKGKSINAFIGKVASDKSASSQIAVADAR